ncbi:hypothetical protein PUMCH_000645 [Australozyma saopauloensis]|uniref:Trafficking protein particle complex subunit n=1 Tax=Australozyma saopauloensis TaxID=291208 RepID=A0AAX4H5C0_9ASCO|nr:hypothetical protein PUMCH_000645 [[Candida] saopauloensis]
MTIYSFYIFDRHCSCIYSREYTHTTPGNGRTNVNNESDVAKLLFGTLYSLKTLSLKLDDSQSLNSLRSFSTGAYRVHFFESLSNFKFVLITDLAVETLQTQLQQLYGVVFVNNVIMNALSPVEFGSAKITNDSFVRLADNFLRLLPVFE